MTRRPSRPIQASRVPVASKPRASEEEIRRRGYCFGCFSFGFVYVGLAQEVCPTCQGEGTQPTAGIPVKEVAL